MLKLKICFPILLLCLSCLASCAPLSQSIDSPIQHEDSFYNINHDDYPLLHLPLVKPVEAKRIDGRSAWRIFITYGLSVRVPNREGIYYYVYNIEGLEQFSVNNGVIVAYSSFVDKDADPFIQENYFHWFVIIPEEEVAEGFHTEEAFRQYIKTMNIPEPVMQTPDEAYELYKRTGCLKWIPECE